MSYDLILHNLVVLLLAIPSLEFFYLELSYFLGSLNLSIFILIYFNYNVQNCQKT